MEYKIVVDNKEKDVVIERKGADYTVKIEGREYEVSAALFDKGKMVFFVNNSPCVAFISKNESGTHIGFKGRSFLVKGEEGYSRHGASHGSEHGDGSVESPMPGNIVAVNVAEGDRIKSGDSLVVIESMKMQNEIAAAGNGRVSRILCKVGDQVNFGDILIEMELDS